MSPLIGPTMNTRFWLVFLIPLFTTTVFSEECHNWCHYGILNEDCQCECISKHIVGEHCDKAKITRCLIASGDGGCPEYYYCHADNDVCNRGLCSSSALGWCIPLPIAELQAERNQLRTVRLPERRQPRRRHLRTVRHQLPVI